MQTIHAPLDEPSLAPRSARTLARTGEAGASGLGAAAFVAVVLAAAATFWLAPRLPMIDLPQHAGQVALWRDLIRGVTPFTADVWINLFTPYLIGYGLALPFAFVMEPPEALRLVLAASFLAYIAAARGLRRELGGDPRLDWLFLFGYFGFAWAWGFYTFLVAAPVALATLRLALRHAEKPDARHAAALVAIALVLLFCHGLQFLYAGALGAALAADQARIEAQGAGWRALIAALARRATPYVLIGAAFVAFLVLRRMLLGQDPPGVFAFGVPVWLRPFALASYVGGNEASLAFLVLTLLAAFAPLIAGYRVTKGPALTMLGVTLAVFFLVPSSVVGTGYVHERFALFVMPLWAMTLRRDPAAPGRSRVLGALALLGSANIALHGWRLAAFADEERDFAPVLAATQPGERILSLIYAAQGAATANPHVYTHWGSWLQGLRGAFVDFNFAYFPPQVVRFRPGRVPPASAAEGSHLDAFDWRAFDGARYDAFLTRGEPATVDSQFVARAACKLEPVARSGLWTLWRKAACP